MKKVLIAMLVLTLSASPISHSAQATECSGVGKADLRDHYGDNYSDIDGQTWLRYTGGSISRDLGGDDFIRQRPGC